MKKFLFAIVVALLACATTFAQDTLEYGDLPYYYNNYYPDCSICLSSNCDDPTIVDTLAYGHLGNFGVFPTTMSSSSIAAGQIYISADTLKIYGIAATYDPQCRGIEELPEVAIYQYEPDSAIRTQYGGGPLTELGRTRIMSRIRHYTYRADILSYSLDSIGNPINIVRRNPEILSVVPVFEYYFSSPIVVHDTFFVGAIDESVSSYILVNYGAVLTEEPTYGCAVRIYLYNDIPILHLLPQKRFAYGGYFPIIRPLHGSDSTAIDMVDYSRMVSLAPNPTDGRFTVTSDDGLRAIMIYDMTGRAVMRRNASGSRVEFDASALPKGCYILAATTTNGVARKKLILR